MLNLATLFKSACSDNSPWHTFYLDICCCCWVVFNSLRPHGLKHARPPCPTPTPGACSNSCHWVSDAIQPSSPLSFPSPPAFNLSQHQGLFQWVSSSHQVAKVLELQPQHQSLQWIFSTDFLLDWLVRSPCSPRDSQDSSPTPQFKSISSSVLSLLYCPLSHPCMTTEKTTALSVWAFVSKVMFLVFNIAV